MDQQQNPPTGGVPGPTGRRLHIAHRRSPSEMTPLVSMYTNQNSMYPISITFDAPYSPPSSPYLVFVPNCLLIVRIAKLRVAEWPRLP